MNAIMFDNIMASKQYVLFWFVQLIKKDLCQLSNVYARCKLDKEIFVEKFKVWIENMITTWNAAFSERSKSSAIKSL